VEIETHIYTFHSQFGDTALLDVLLSPFLDDCSNEVLTLYDCQQPARTLLLLRGQSLAY